ncbi:MAG: elongation factor 4, partial [Candidatus Portnoybacteria bacterium CG10_big_fil_rev_8_21_14_0_10_44_7]
MSNIRNFCIIAHIDHGKSTLADRFLELTQTIEKRKMRAQVLDQMDIERERGITIKMTPVTMEYGLKDQKYTLNLIDTPGHVDFSYEVSRSLAAVEGAILLVDATRGVQAQTLANLQLAWQQGLTIIPVLNKIDLPSARVAEAEQEVRATLASVTGKAFVGKVLPISAKSGSGVSALLASVIEKIPPPTQKTENLQALIFDSVYDHYKGVIAYVRLFGGQIQAGQKIKIAASQKETEALEVGIFRPHLLKKDSLVAGQIGYIATGLKDISLCRVGGTIVLPQDSAPALPGYREPKPMVFASFYPASEQDNFGLLKEALEKLSLNDAALTFELESSEALGRGFKCGFLGMLHLEIISERLRREYDLELLITTPSVAYEILEKTRDAVPKIVKAAQEMPDAHLIEYIREPWMRLEILTPS